MASTTHAPQRAGRYALMLQGTDVQTASRGDPWEDGQVKGRLATIHSFNCYVHALAHASHYTSSWGHLPHIFPPAWNFDHSPLVFQSALRDLSRRKRNTKKETRKTKQKTEKIPAQSPTSRRVCVYMLASASPLLSSRLIPPHSPRGEATSGAG